MREANTHEHQVVVSSYSARAQIFNLLVSVVSRMRSICFLDLSLSSVAPFHPRKGTHCQRLGFNGEQHPFALLFGAFDVR